MWYRLKLNMRPFGRVAATETAFAASSECMGRDRHGDSELEVAMEEGRMGLIDAKGMQTSF